MREIKYVNAEQKVVQIFGHYKDLITLSLSLSLSLSQVLTYNSLYIIKGRGHPRQDTAFFANRQGKPQCFYIPIERQIIKNKQ